MIEKHYVTDADMDLARRTVAKDATADELMMFLRLCRTYGLDPFRRELVFRKSRTDGTVSFITSRDGYLKAAMRDPHYAGIQSMPVKEGDEFSVDPTKGEVLHRFGAKRGKLIGSWAIAFHRERPPIIAWADFEEYATANGNSPTWRNYPSAMIQKVAEVAALRRQFNLSGIVAREEIELEASEEPAHPRLAPAPEPRAQIEVAPAAAVEDGLPTFADLASATAEPMAPSPPPFAADERERNAAFTECEALLTKLHEKFGAERLPRSALENWFAERFAVGYDDGDASQYRAAKKWLEERYALFNRQNVAQQR